ncbi:MAG: cyclic nucleotide-binding protein [Clostridiaceae bacterium]|jgi:CRP-like cAMP-binding protein|nr:cyclic nucleotide-binding protein [Clostridiaceae bacterium]
MDKISDTLINCPLFKGVSKEQIEEHMNSIKYQTVVYKKNDVIAIEGDDASSLGIIISGSIEIQKLYASGKIITIDRLSRGKIFGEVIIFSQMGKYPSTIISNENSKILFIPKSEMLKLCSIDIQILNNFMALLSNKILMLNKKLRNLSFETIRQKVSNFIMDEYKRQKNNPIKFTISRKEMADYLGIQRPSLSRELIHMKEENLIDFDKHYIRIIDLEALEDYL